ncbi:MAG: PD-(D/E)XK nuclease-like domain-containing protein [Oceanicaulis sp.]|jgi:hypothetical protein|nr:PD-(D/E)XK nuclease-like domain-containing protein [Oceanicaulis sp.]
MTALPLTEPGIYADIPMAAYHGQLTIGPSISSSGLRTIYERSPAHYFKGSYLNPKAEPIDTEALRFGKAAHSLLLGDEVFADNFEVAPFVLGYNRNEMANGKAPKRGEDPDWTATSKDAWKDQVEQSGRIPLSQAAFAELQGMKTALLREPLIQDGLLDGEAERSIVWRDDETGVWLKARPDVLPKAGWVVDYKTTTDGRDFKVSRAVTDRLYHMQLALVCEGLVALGFPPPNQYALVFQEKTDPHAVTIKPIDVEAIMVGVKQNRIAIRRFAQCLSDGRWPAYEISGEYRIPPRMIDEVSHIETPDWLRALEASL